MGLSISSQNVVLNWLRGVDPTAPDGLWLSLHSRLPVSGSSEISTFYGGRIAFSGGDFSEPFAGSGGTQEVRNIVTFVSGPASQSLPVLGFGVWDAALGGTMLLSGTCATIGSAGVGVALEFPPGHILLRATVSETSGAGMAYLALPIATEETLGGIRVGEGLSITADGVLSVESPGGGGSGSVVLVEGGAGLTGSVSTSGSLAVGAGPGLLVNPDSVEVDRDQLDTWYAAAASGALAATALQVVNLGYVSATRTITNTGGAPAVLPLFSATDAGLAPPTGGASTAYLRADGTWQTPAGTGGGTVNQVTGGAGLVGNVTNIGSLDVGAGAGIAVNADSVAIDRVTVDGWYAPAAHVGAGGSAHALASGSAPGFMAAADFTKLGGVAPGATANSSDAVLLARSSHTGTQPAASISDFPAASRTQIEAALVAGASTTITPAGSGATRTLTIDFNGSTGGGHVIQDDGVDQPQRAKLNLVGAAVSDDAANDATVVVLSAGVGAASAQIELLVAVTSDSANLITGTSLASFRMPYAMKLEAVRADVTGAPTGTGIILGIKQGGAPILSTPLSIDATKDTSATATTPAVISTSALVDNGKITIDITQIGSIIPGRGLKVLLKGKRITQAGYGVRDQASDTQVAVAAAATVQGTLTLPRMAVIHSITLSRAGWFRLYETGTARAADAGRARTVDPLPDAGVLAEVILGNGVSSIAADKPVVANADSPTTNFYPYAYTNDGASGDATVTVTYLPLEA